MIKHTEATLIGYHKPAKESPAGLEEVLVNSTIKVPKKGTRPPNTPLPI